MIRSYKKYNLIYLLAFLMLVSVSCRKEEGPIPHFDNTTVSSGQDDQPVMRLRKGGGNGGTNGDGSGDGNGSVTGNGDSDIIGGDDNEDDDGTGTGSVTGKGGSAIIGGDDNEDDDGVGSTGGNPGPRRGGFNDGDGVGSSNDPIIGVGDGSLGNGNGNGEVGEPTSGGGN